MTDNSGVSTYKVMACDQEMSTILHSGKIWALSYWYMLLVLRYVNKT